MNNEITIQPRERRQMQSIAPVRPTIPEILAADFDNLPFVMPPAYKNQREANKAAAGFEERHKKLMGRFDERAEWKEPEESWWGGYFMHCQHQAEEKRRSEKQKVQQRKKQLTMQPG